MALLTLGKLDAMIKIIDRELDISESKVDDGLNISENDNIICKPFGKTCNGEQVDLYILKNGLGMELEIINYGGHLRCLRVPSQSSKIIDVVIGLDNIRDYERKNPYLGSIVGRYANRICNGKFILNNKEYNLPINNGPNCLHGGINNFAKKVWNVKILKNEIGINLHYLSKDGEEGFPGNLDLNVKYVLNKNENKFEIIYEAITDKTTILNLTNHSYFNLNGDFTKNSILNKSHSFQLNADYFLPINDVSIPISSELMNVVNTPFDFKKISDNLGQRLLNKDKNQQIINGNGIDHNFVINGYNDNNKQKLNECALVIGNKSGIKLKILTTEPGVQFYTANYLNGDIYGKNKTYDQRCAFCLETQHFPDSPNRKTYPSVVLNPEETFKSITQYCFS